MNYKTVSKAFTLSEKFRDALYVTNFIWVIDFLYSDLILIIGVNIIGEQIYNILKLFKI